VHAKLFREGSYAPVRIEGEHGQHVLAFMRCHGREAVIAAVGRHFGRFTNAGREWPRGADWHACLLADGMREMTDLLAPGRCFSGPGIAVADLFAVMPFAVLHARLPA